MNALRLAAVLRAVNGGRPSAAADCIEQQQADLAEMRREAERLRAERDKLRNKLEIAIADKDASDQGWADQAHRDALKLVEVAKERDKLQAEKDDLVASWGRANQELIFALAAANEERDKLRAALEAEESARMTLRAALSECIEAHKWGRRYDDAYAIAVDAMSHTKLRAEALKP